MPFQNLKISVIIAAYHGEKYIGEQLESLFRQTRVPDEILIGDDSADDKTFQAVEAVRSHYAGELRYFKNTPKQGICSSFEKLYKLASGNLVFFCDQDDVWLPEKIEKMTAEIQKYPQCDLLFCDSFCTDSRLNKSGETMFSLYGINNNDVHAINRGKAFPLVVMRNIPFSSHDIVLRKPLTYNIFPFNSHLGAYHDQHLGYLTSYMGKMRCLPEPLTLYRRHEKNVSVLYSTATAKKKYNIRDGRIHSEKIMEFVWKMKRMREILGAFPVPISEIPGNKKYLDEMIAFFEKRNRLLHFRKILRCMHISSKDFINYFRYCKGFRTLAHDLICDKIEKDKLP